MASRLGCPQSLLNDGFTLPGRGHAKLTETSAERSREGRGRRAQNDSLTQQVVRSDLRLAGDGKSTLIGRLAQGRPVTDDNESLLVFASLLNQGQGDALVHRCLSTERREFVLADTTEHERYTRSVMAAGANADAAVLLVDARSGIVDQTRRDTILASLLAVAHMVLAVNKMDLVGYDEHVFESISAAFTNFARELTFKTVQVIPVSAWEADNVSRRSDHMPWYAGPCLLACLENLEPEDGGSNKPFRMPVQSANCPSSGFAVLIGTIASGTAQLGDEVTLLRRAARRASRPSVATGPTCTPRARARPLC